MSVQSHPLLSPFNSQSSSTTLLATVTLLPLLDGIFPSLVLSGSLSTPPDAIQTGLLIFSGSAAATIVLTEFTDPPQTYIRPLIGLALTLTGFAIAETILAPTLQTALNISIFTRFAAIVIISIAATTVSSTLATHIPNPSTIAIFGLLASVHPQDLSIKLSINLILIEHTVLAVLSGLGLTVILIFLQTPIQKPLNLHRFRLGSALALLTLAFSLLQQSMSNTPLMVFLITCALSYKSPSSC